MSGIRSWVSFRLGRLLPWLRQSRASAEIRKELDLHLTLETDENLKLGMSREEAARLARVTLGNGPLIREDAGAVWSWHWWDACRRGIGLGVRGLRRRVGASLTVVLILALGIGSTTAMFALVDGVLLAPLPYDEPSQLATVQVNVPQIEAQFPVFPGNLRSWLAWRNCRVTCDDLAVLNPGMWTLTGDGDPQVLKGAWVSANFFDLLRVAPGHSQVFHEATESRSATDHGVVLTHALWQRVYRGDPQIVGRLITLDDARLEVIGVLPATFELPPVEFLHPVAFDFGHLELFRALRYTPQRIQQITEEVLQVNQGSLYPALHRLEQRGWLASSWGASENNRQAKFYQLTRAGRRQLERETKEWARLSAAVARIMGAT